MKRIIFAILVATLLFSCGKEPTRVTLSDDNQDEVSHLPPNADVLGNTEVFFIPGTIQGSAIWILNGPGANVGIDIRDSNNSSFIYYSNSFISKGGNAAQTGTQIPVNRWMRVRLVVYKAGLSNIIINIIKGLGLDFFDGIQQFMIEKIYVVNLKVGSDGSRQHGPVNEYQLLQAAKY